VIQNIRVVLPKNSQKLVTDLSNKPNTKFMGLLRQCGKLKPKTSIKHIPENARISLSQYGDIVNLQVKKKLRADFLLNKFGCFIF